MMVIRYFIKNNTKGTDINCCVAVGKNVKTMQGLA